jgi:flagellar FliJ protein
MTPIEPLLSLLAQTERERDAVQAESRRADAAVEQARRQLGQLEDYRREYEARWGARPDAQATPEIVQCYLGFRTRLDQAVDQQGQAVETAEARAARERVRLTEQEIRVASVRKLIEHRQAEASRVEARREQRETDEFAARARLARTAAARRRDLTA